ncbi:MAG: hypothetical protein K0Q87_4423, partial [Neobacillus sp.]|nr:hypothetical protein [Neobacillus sp.]
SDTQVVYGHAIYIDENDQPLSADHGYQTTKVYLGEQRTFQQNIKYWCTVYQIPQPTVFMRKTILDQFGLLDEQYKFIFDYAYFLNLMKNQIEFRLIDRIQAFYRIHSSSKTSGFESFYPELYNYSRPHWGNQSRGRFIETAYSFFKAHTARLRSYYMNTGGKVDFFAYVRFIGRESWVLLQIISGRGNPELHYKNLVKEHMRKYD